jgi:protein deglycase
VASLDCERTVTGRSRLALQADAALADVTDDYFDLLLVPGGPGVQALRADGRAAKLAKTFFETGRFVAAICAAPVVLKDANLLEDKRFTAHFSVYGELPGALGDERVVQDGTILTSRGAGTAVDFGLAVVQTLFGADKANEIARAIMA